MEELLESIDKANMQIEPGEYKYICQKLEEHPEYCPLIGKYIEDSQITNRELELFNKECYEFRQQQGLLSVAKITIANARSYELYNKSARQGEILKQGSKYWQRVTNNPAHNTAFQEIPDEDIADIMKAPDTTPAEVAKKLEETKR